MAIKFTLRWNKRGTPEKGKTEVVVDDKDAHLLRAYPWRPDSNGFIVRTDRNETRLSHEILCAGYGGDIYVIHIDSDKNNFRRSNLLAVSKEEWSKLSLVGAREANRNHQPRNGK